MASKGDQALKIPDQIAVPASIDFAELYDAYADFVWRSLLRLGISQSQAPDVAQEVFIVIHRRLASFEGRSQLKTWIFGIVFRVALDHRRKQQRKPLEPLEEDVPDVRQQPHNDLVNREAVRTLYALLAKLSEEKRAVFILAELEQMTVPEIAEALDTNIHTTGSRLRAARQEFEAALERERLREASLARRRP